MLRLHLLLPCLVVLMSCNGAEPIALRSLAAQDRIETFAAIPPGSTSSQCWSNEITPAVTAPRVVQVEAIPAEVDATGRTLRPAIFRDQLQMDIIRPARTTWFEVPCPALVTQTFWSSLQRALAARGFYAGPITGIKDTQTGAAIAAYQTPMGLSSPTLSLIAAQKLGLLPRVPR